MAPPPVVTRQREAVRIISHLDNLTCTDNYNPGKPGFYQFTFPGSNLAGQTDYLSAGRSLAGLTNSCSPRNGRVQHIRLGAVAMPPSRGRDPAGDLRGSRMDILSPPKEAFCLARSRDDRRLTSSSLVISEAWGWPDGPERGCFLRAKAKRRLSSHKLHLGAGHAAQPGT